MSCEPARDEYIEAVADVVEAARCLAAFTEQFLDKVKSRPGRELGSDEWHLYTECLNRLVRQQRTAYARYKERSRHHVAEDRHCLSARSA